MILNYALTATLKNDLKISTKKILKMAQNLCCVLETYYTCDECKQNVCNHCYWSLGHFTVTDKLESGGKIWIREQRYKCKECYEA